MGVGAGQPSFIGVALRKQASVFLAACALAAVLLHTPITFADDLSSESVLNTSGQTQTQLNLMISGNVTSNIDGSDNPFGAGGSVTSSYNSVNNNTLVSFSGSGITNGGGATIGLSTTISDQLQYKYWGATPTPPSSPSLRLPAPSFFVSNPTNGPNTQFIILYATIELSNGQTAGEWNEQQVPANQPFQVGIGNNDNLDGPMFAFNVGFQFSNTEIPLDDLNLNDYPPSSFTPVPGITNGTSIASDGSVESPDIPEPSAMALSLVALATITILVGRRSRSTDRKLG
jgi:hypothetical protein